MQNIQRKWDTVTESDGYRYTYDLNGNLTSLKSPEGSEIKYIYDDADRLVRTEEKVQVLNSSSSSWKDIAQGSINQRGYPSSHYLMTFGIPSL